MNVPVHGLAKGSGNWTNLDKGYSARTDNSYSQVFVEGPGVSVVFGGYSVEIQRGNATTGASICLGYNRHYYKSDSSNYVNLHLDFIVVI